MVAVVWIKSQKKKTETRFFCFIWTVLLASVSIHHTTRSLNDQTERRIKHIFQSRLWTEMIKSSALYFVQKIFFRFSLCAITVKTFSLIGEMQCSSSCIAVSKQNWTQFQSPLLASFIKNDRRFVRRWVPRFSWRDVVWTCAVKLSCVNRTRTGIFSKLQASVPHKISVILLVFVAWYVCVLLVMLSQMFEI